MSKLETLKAKPINREHESLVKRVRLITQGLQHAYWQTFYFPLTATEIAIITIYDFGKTPIQHINIMLSKTNGKYCSTIVSDLYCNKVNRNSK